MQQDTLNRILYVEDDADIRKIVSISLETVGGYTVAACGSCADALEVVDEFDPDLLLLDVMMPEVDGPSTLRELRKRDSAADAPAVFITAKVQSGNLAHYRRLGAFDVIVKPFDPMALPAKIGQIWRRYRSEGDTMPADERLATELARLSADFVAQLPGQLRAVQDAAAAWLDAPRDSGRYEIVARRVHKLKGSGSTFGCPGVTRAARTLEQQLAAYRRDIDAGVRPAIGGLESAMAQLQTEATRAQPGPQGRG